MRAMVLAIGVLLSGCATTHGTAASQERGLLHFEVLPEDATIWVDDNYLGQVNAWMDQTVRLPVGVRRVELRAKGFMTQRFDILVAQDEEVTLRLHMQPNLEDVEVDVPEES